MQGPNRTLIGFKVDDCLVDTVLSDGPFSTVFAANSPEGKRVVYKIAKSNDDSSNDTTPGRFFTKAMAAGIGGGPQEVEPDKDELLRRQAELLIKMAGTALIPVQLYGPHSATVQYSMPFIEGQTLREQIETCSVPHQALLDICTAMAEIADREQASYHGDLKPDNIILNKTGGITLLDPGYFGRLRYASGGEHPVTVTTPQYYPYLQPLDILAFGYILWECLTGIHPLVRPLSMGLVNDHELGESLLHELQNQSVVGNHMLEPLRALPLPSAANLNITPATERILLKAIGLELLDNKLETTSLFENFSQMLAALKSIDAPEIWQTAFRATYIAPRGEPEIDKNDVHGIKGLKSHINGKTDNRPYDFAQVQNFAFAGLSMEDKLPVFAAKVNRHIEVSVMAGDFSSLYWLAGVAAGENSQYYLLLHGEPERIDEDRTLHIYIAKFAESGQIQMLSDTEFLVAVVEATKLLDSDNFFDMQLLEKVFGEIDEINPEF